MDFLFKDNIVEYDPIIGLYHRIIDTNEFFPGYIFKEEWNFLPVLADTTGGHDGVFHEYLCKILEYNSTLSYYLVCLDDYLAPFLNFPIFKIDKSDNRKDVSKIWTTNFKTGPNQHSFLYENSYGFALYFDETLQWIICDVMDISTTFVGFKKDTDLPFYHQLISNDDFDKLDMQDLEDSFYSKELKDLFIKNYKSRIIE